MEHAKRRVGRRLLISSIALAAQIALRVLRHLGPSPAVRLWAFPSPAQMDHALLLGAWTTLMLVSGRISFDYFWFIIVDRRRRGLLAPDPENLLVAVSTGVCLLSVLSLVASQDRFVATLMLGSDR